MHIIEIWRADLRAYQHQLPAYQALLNHQELERAGRFKNALLRDRFILGRGILRTLLAGRLRTDPASLAFSSGPYGKPALCGLPLYFNVSHSADRLLIALADLEHIGVDIEAVKPRTALPALAGRIMSGNEYAAWAALPADLQLRLFYRLWTQKEAFVKAVGRGLGIGLNQCEVEWENGAQFSTIPGEYGRGEDWKIIDIQAGAGFCAALVAPNAAISVLESDFNGAAIRL
ncbi:MAG: 4'-phosphopantetheinyl transferase superfamily protein [Methylomonas sp.]|jgi:4'-phosphopantetheinyl transferase